MAKVSLDGLRIEFAHSNSPEDVTTRLEAFATDVAQNRFKDWGVTVDRDGESLKLAGRRKGTHFDADITSQDGLAVISLSGSIELNRVVLGLGGGAKGIRNRVETQIKAALKEHLT